MPFLEKPISVGRLQLSSQAQVLFLILGLGALLFIPYLGAVGLWDPWETHYGEVGRMMVHRSDYVYPYWESAWFFSKPPLTMWLQALGMQLSGVERVTGALPRLTEWAMRLPFALLSMGALCLLALSLSRTVGRRAGVCAAFALATMPLYFLLTRQTVTDTPFVSLLICAMSCAIIGLLDDTTRHRGAWWYAFYVFCGLGMLAKGLLAVGLPAVVLLSYAALFVVPWNREAWKAHVSWLKNRHNLAAIFLWDVPSFRAKASPPPVLWAQLFRMRFLTGCAVFLAVCAPWFLTLSLFSGVDDESKSFFYRFFIHDHLNRLTSGVHTTTPGGTFTYFVEQGGYALFPWVALLPGIIALASKVRLRSEHPRDRVAFLAVAWLGIGFTLLTLSATKFHHYIFPLLPAAAILMGLFVDAVWEEGVAAHGVSLLLGIPLFVVVGKDLVENPKNFTDLFVYNYERPYPMKEVAERVLSLRELLLPGLSNDPVADGLSVVRLSSLLGLVLMAFGALQVAEALFPKVGPRPAKSSSAGMVLGALVGALGIFLLSPSLARSLLSSLPGLGSSVESLLAPSTPKSLMAFVFSVGGTVAVYAALARSKRLLLGAFGSMALYFALWFNWSHWANLSHHWTQRDQFSRYFAQRKPGEPIAAFLMNWRGETFYSRNTVKQIKENARLLAYANQPGREWALVEHNRFGILKNAVGADKTVTMVDRDLNNKFVLVTIE